MARVKQLADKDGELIYPVVDPTQLHFSGNTDQVVRGDGSIGQQDATDITNYNGTILNLVKGIYPEQSHSWLCKIDGGSANISDKPSGSTNQAFSFTAFKVRDNGSSDYGYKLMAYTNADSNVFECFVLSSSSSLLWKRVITSGVGQNISSDMILDNAVTKSKINFSTLKPVWDMTYTTNTSSSDVTWTKTTLLGNSITVHQCNGGTGMMIDSGASSYRIAKHYVTFDSNYFTAVAIGVNNVAVESAIWGRFTGITNETQKNFQQVKYVAESSTNYGTAVELNATTVSSGAIEYTVTRTKGTTFVIMGTLHLCGNNTSVVFTIQCTAKDNNSFPTIFLRGTGSSITNVIHTMEILET